MSIREAGPADVAVIASVTREAFRDVAVRFGLTRENCPTHPSHCPPDWIETDMAEGVRYFLLEGEAGAVASVALRRTPQERFLLERLAVLPEHRRAGHGACMVRRVLEEARLHGAARIELAIIAEHDGLRDWYQRLGFAAVETRKFAHLPFLVTFMAMEI